MCKQKQDELLLEDIWTLLRAGRLEEACELCRSAGQVGQLISYDVSSLPICGTNALNIFRHGELPPFAPLVA